MDKYTSRTIAAIGALLAVQSAVVSAQVTTLRSPTPQARGEFGNPIAAWEDVNDDGTLDIAIGALVENDADGQVHVFDGRTGAFIATLTSPNDDRAGLFGSSLATVGNITFDLRRSLIIGALGEDPGEIENAGRAYRFNPNTLSRSRTFESPTPARFGNFGVSVAGVPDINEDNEDEIAIAARGENAANGISDAGQVHLFDGGSSSLIRTLNSPRPVRNGAFGWTIAGFFDVNGNGTGDVAVGAIGEGENGVVYMMDGGTGNVIYSVRPPSEADSNNFGTVVAALGDSNGDEVEELAVGAWTEDADLLEGVGRVYIYDGATGTLVMRLESGGPIEDGGFGRSVAPLPDANADGVDDILVGAPGETARGVLASGRVYVFDGVTGERIETFNSPNPNEFGSFGIAVEGLPDRTGDERGDLVIGAFNETANAIFFQAGHAYLTRSGAGGELPDVSPPVPGLTCDLGLGASEGSGSMVWGDLFVLGLACLALVVYRRARLGERHIRRRG